MKKLKYRPPPTLLRLAFPEIIELSPGMVQEIDVVFRPIKEENYDDTIYFKLEEGVVGSTGAWTEGKRGFHVPVRALLSTLQASVPSGLDFGLCPVAETAERTFYIENTGEVPAPFVWTVPEPFRFEPDSGIVAVGGAVAIVASMHPLDASVVGSNAVCEVGLGVNAIKPQPTPTCASRRSASTCT